MCPREHAAQTDAIQDLGQRIKMSQRVPVRPPRAPTINHRRAALRLHVLIIHLDWTLVDDHNILLDLIALLIHMFQVNNTGMRTSSEPTSVVQPSSPSTEVRPERPAIRPRPIKRGRRRWPFLLLIPLLAGGAWWGKQRLAPPVPAAAVNPAELVSVTRGRVERAVDSSCRVVLESGCGHQVPG